MTKRDRAIVPASDSTMSGVALPEVTQLHLSQNPTRPSEVDGVLCVVRLGEEEFTIIARAGATTIGDELATGVWMAPGSEDFADWVELRHNLIHDAQSMIGAVAPALAELLAPDSRSSRHSAEEPRS